MILRLIFIVACLQATILSAQTDEQKQFMFERINHDAKGNVVLSKTESFDNKEELFKKAVIIPVFKIVFDKDNTTKLLQNKNYFLVSYIDRIYVFLDKVHYRLLENNPLIQNIAKYNLQKKKFNIVYFTENFSFDKKYLNPLLTDERLDFIIDRGAKFNMIEYINNTYGSFAKYNEIKVLDEQREKLTSKDYNRYLENDYQAFEYNYPKDTTLVLKSLMNQIRTSTGDFTKNQESQLLRKITKKINSFQFKEKLMKESLIARKVNDSVIKSILLKSRIENQQSLINQKSCEKPEGNYEFKVYGVSINNELLEVLTNNQFISYKKYVDLYLPNTNNGDRDFRYGYGKEILIREGIIMPFDTAAFSEYIKNKIKDIYLTK